MKPGTNVYIQNSSNDPISGKKTRNLARKKINGMVQVSKKINGKRSVQFEEIHVLLKHFNFHTNPQHRPQ